MFLTLSSVSAQLLVSDQPWDFAWNPQIVDRVFFLCQNTDEKAYSEIVATLHRYVTEFDFLILLFHDRDSI